MPPSASAVAVAVDRLLGVAVWVASLFLLSLSVSLTRMIPYDVSSVLCRSGINVNHIGLFRQIWA